ncbi:MAG TPA: hypothetical protein VJ824_05875 [Bacillota bacterium]|nr:hypothetical protein [Bacillota bacterium]
MSIQIRGYDITECTEIRDENHYFFHGVAHIETDDKKALDLPFEGEHEQGMTGFVHFHLDDPDQIELPAIRKQSDAIREMLAEHVLIHGYATGEYRQELSI